MSTARGNRRLQSARPPGTDWQDSYLSLEERYRQVQKKLNDREEEVKQLKVAQRKAGHSPPSRTTATTKNVRDSTTSLSRAQSALTHVRHGDAPRSGAAAPTASAPSRRQLLFEEVESIPESEYVHVSSRAQADVARAASIQQVAAWGSEAALPDPSMIWGAEGSAQSLAMATALYHANEELRRKLQESSTLLQTLQVELSASRTQATKSHARSEELAQQVHQIVRERDLAVQKSSHLKQLSQDLEKTLSTRISEEDKVRFSLEQQITDLRSRLVIGADNNELLSRDVNSLLHEAKDKTGEVMSLRSKLALVESAFSSQKHHNENLLVELKSLNSQLVDERKRLLLSTREAHGMALTRERMEDLERDLTQARNDHAVLEQEHVRVLGQFVHVTEDALRYAHDEVRADLQEWRDAAQHWEEVAQLLYKDVTERTRTHWRCREECDEAKAQRDAAAVELRSLREEVALCKAKLEVMWPSHESDTKGLDAHDILRAYSRRKRGIPKPTSTTEAESVRELYSAAVNHVDPEKVSEEGMGLNLPPDTTSAQEKVRELFEANSCLLSELEQLRLTNELLQERMDRMSGRVEKHKQKLSNAEKGFEAMEAAGQELLDKQLDRVQFLEAQVRSLRGYGVASDTPLDRIDPSDTILELFLGQLVSVDAAIAQGRESFYQVFCSVDFLLHETVMTPTLTGFNGFFDTSISFQISMDALLLYYLRTRALVVQLHRIRSEEEVESALAQTPQPHAVGAREEGAPSIDAHPLGMAERLFETLAEGHASLEDLIAVKESLTSSRPTLKGHLKLKTPSGRHVASLEFQLTARAPFQDSFRHLVEEALVEAEHTPPVDSQTPRRPGMLHWMQQTSSSSSSRDGHHQGGGWSSGLRLARRSPHSGSSDASRLSAHQVAPPHHRSEQVIHGRNEPRGYEHDDVGIVNMRLLPPPPVERRLNDASMLASEVEAPHEPPATGWTHVPQSVLDTSPSNSRAGVQTGEINCLSVDVMRLELPADLPLPIPRLGCRFAVPCASRPEVHLLAPKNARYTIEYSQESAEGTLFFFDHIGGIAQAVRQPLTFFLVDEDTNSVWAMATSEWSETVQDHGQLRTFALTLVRGNATIPGAVLRIRLRASRREAVVAPPESGVAMMQPPTTAATAVPAIQGGSVTMEEELMRLEYMRLGSAQQQTAQWP